MAARYTASEAGRFKKPPAAGLAAFTVGRSRLIAPDNSFVCHTPDRACTYAIAQNFNPRGTYA